MKNDVSHHGILLNLIFTQFCRIFPGKTGFRIRKTGYPIQNFICVKTYLGQVEYYLRISAKLVKYYPKKPGLSRFPENPDPGSGFCGNPEKTLILGYYLTNLAEIFRKYSPWPIYVLTQINFWVGYPVFRIWNLAIFGRNQV